LRSNAFRKSERSALRFSPKPSSRACLFHAWVDRPSGPASRRIESMVCWLSVSFGPALAGASLAGALAGTTTHEVIISPSSSIPTSTSSSSQAICSPASKSFANSTFAVIRLRAELSTLSWASAAPGRLVCPRGPWKSFDAVDYATLEWVDWFNNRRLLETIGHIPPSHHPRNPQQAGPLRYVRPAQPGLLLEAKKMITSTCGVQLRLDERLGSGQMGYTSLKTSERARINQPTESFIIAAGQNSAARANSMSPGNHHSVRVVLSMLFCTAVSERQHAHRVR